MTATPPLRAEAVRRAIEEVRCLGHFHAPLREMEEAAMEPLPELDVFLPQWRALLEGRGGEQRAQARGHGDTDGDRWLREVVQRLEGVAGLAALARATKRAHDLRAWCQALVEARDWKAALIAYDEAAAVVSDESYWRGAFLDGAVLAAQELGRPDLPARLERAWREAPSMTRLRRWLGRAGDKAGVKRRAAEALEVCSRKASRQRALLHVLLGDLEAAAQLLAAAPGLGWSESEHPGRLVFSCFQALLGGRATGLVGTTDSERVGDVESDADEVMPAWSDEPRLATASIDQILELADVRQPPHAGARRAMLVAMQAAAGKRVAAVTESKRRRHYGHAAELVCACAALDSTPETAQWIADIRDAYRRFPAFQAELARRGFRS